MGGVLILNLINILNNTKLFCRSLSKKKRRKRSLSQQWDEQAHDILHELQIVFHVPSAMNPPAFLINKIWHSSCALITEGSSLCPVDKSGNGLASVASIM